MQYISNKCSCFFCTNQAAPKLKNEATALVPKALWNYFKIILLIQEILPQFWRVKR